MGSNPEPRKSKGRPQGRTSKGDNKVQRRKMNLGDDNSRSRESRRKAKAF